MRPHLGRQAEWPLVEVALIRYGVVKALSGRVQRDLRTPTELFFARFSIAIIPRLVAEFAFMGRSTRLVMSSFAGRWMGRKQNVGWKFQHGCSRGRHALRLSFWQLGSLSA